MKKLTFKDYVVLSLAYFNHIGPDGGVNVDKGINKIIYKLIMKIVGGEDKFDAYVIELIKKLNAAGYDTNID